MGGESIEPLSELPDELDTQAISGESVGGIPPEREIDISFFSHKSRKSTRLIGNRTDQGTMRARREWLSFDLNEPIYVTSIKIAASGYDDYHEMELSLIDALSGDEIKEKRKFSGSEFAFEPKRFIKGFGLRPDSAWSFTKTQYISRIDVRGLEQKSFYEVVLIYENLSREKEKIEESLSAYFEKAKESELKVTKNTDKLSHLTAEIDEYHSKIISLKEEISVLSIQRDELHKRIEVRASVEKEMNERIQAVEISIQNLNNDRKEVSVRIAESRKELKDLKDNIDLFPTEIAGYVSQGTRNIRLYFWLSLFPMGIMAFVTFRLFHNAERLLDFDLTIGLSGVIKYLLSRSPYVVVSATILGISYSIIRGLISEIVNINRRRQELFKISIIATDISYASQRGLDLEPDQLYELRTQTKMEMLKEHLKMNVGDDFTYSPGRALARRLKSMSINKEPHLPIARDEANADATDTERAVSPKMPK